ncbi:monovalent cation/H(+) antiporter subunit G [Suttonella sp. R2A3]|uniref:cation:proton antiporter n=1 Tax=Suttonella sp. R2A3 TaxID=2908648 RepID=UPI001F175FBF|nr:monovalent cation/H(+) antiporter subunit G [Suttonella sp. R2A3]UJF24030.1 monovalent cation/H(+) antiporter subunit G [Suttonella sp. R2A3]
MALIYQVLCAVLLLSGVIVLVVAAFGVLLLPDMLSKQHAATMATTLAVMLLALGAGLWMHDWGWSVRLLMIVTFMLCTMPIASHVLARAAVAGRGLIHDREHPDVVHYRCFIRKNNDSDAEADKAKG